MSLPWKNDAKIKFEQMIEKTPVFIREHAKNKVGSRAEKLAKENNRSEINEKDMVDAFFLETPGGFHGPLTVDMEALGINYQQYGHERP